MLHNTTKNIKIITQSYSNKIHFYEEKGVTFTF